MMDWTKSRKHVFKLGFWLVWARNFVMLQELVLGEFHR
jgi:hypothetical protein